jgi:cytochrome c oxidase subunit 4
MMNTLSRRLYSSSYAHATASLGPSLHNIPQRWQKLKELEQADIVDFLALRSEKPWTQLGTDEKRALYYISFGEWGPRATTPQKSVSSTMLSGLFSGMLLIAAGVSLYNYALDQEYEEKYNNTLERVKELQQQEALTLQEETQKRKKYWLF